MGVIVNLIIADDHTLFREGMKKLFKDYPDICVIAEASNGSECIEQLLNLKEEADILLLDINMPEKNGIEVLQFIRENELSVKTFILTAHQEIEYLLEAEDLKVEGYALKNISFQELIDALQHILNGKQYIQTSLIPSLNNNLMKRDLDKDKIDSLTRREMDMIIQIASGLSNKEIAKNLSITERTVKNHISSLFKKIEVSDRTQAAVFAIKNNLIKV